MNIWMRIILGVTGLACIGWFLFSELPEARRPDLNDTVENLEDGVKAISVSVDGPSERQSLNEFGEVDTAAVAKKFESYEEARVDLERFDPVPFDSAHSHTLGLWTGKLERHPRGWANDGSGFSLTMTLPEGRELDVDFVQTESYAAGKGLHYGHVRGSEYSEVIVSYVSDAVAGVIRLPGESVSWEIRNRGNGLLELEKVDLNQLKGCAACRLD